MMSKASGGEYSGISRQHSLKESVEITDQIFRLVRGHQMAFSSPFTGG